MEIIIANRFKLGKKIGSGSFGSIYEGTDILKEEEVAIKLEYGKTRNPQLLYESRIYRIVQGGTGIPKSRWSGVTDGHNVLVMDLLGESLEDLFIFCGRKLSLKSVLMLADQMIRRVEFIHSKYLLHRDIKPENFVMGRGSHANQVYIIDFGLAKMYKYRLTHQHVPYRENKGYAGSPRFFSRNTHLGIDQTRRDDMESLGFAFVYLLRGSLPWQGLRGMPKAQKIKKIGEIKNSISIKDLCRGCPPEFATYFDHCRSLSYAEKPNYAFLRTIFRNLFVLEGFQYDNMYDWTILRLQESQIAVPPARFLNLGVETSLGNALTGKNSCGQTGPEDSVDDLIIAFRRSNVR